MYRVGQWAIMVVGAVDVLFKVNPASYQKLLSRNQEGGFVELLCPMA